MSRGLAGGAARNSAGPGSQEEVRRHRHPHPRRRFQVGSARCTVYSSSHGPWGFTKRCRLSLLANSAYVGGWGGVAVPQPMSTDEHITRHGAQINFGDLHVPPYLTYVIDIRKLSVMKSLIRVAPPPEVIFIQDYREGVPFGLDTLK